MFELTLRHIGYACYQQFHTRLWIITDDVDAILAGAQLNIDALVHQQDASASEVNQKPPKINRPSILRKWSEELWNTFWS